MTEETDQPGLRVIHWIKQLLLQISTSKCKFIYLTIKSTIIIDIDFRIDLIEYNCGILWRVYVYVPLWLSGFCHLMESDKHGRQ